MAASHAQPFKQHVDELRTRVMIVVAVAFAGACVGYGFHTLLIKLLSKPLHQHLYYTSPSGGLQFTMQICLFIGVLVALPVAVYQLVRFVQPAIKRYTHRRIITQVQTLRFVLASYSLALIGAAFAYFIVLPAAFHFFAGFSSGDVKSLITADKYFSFVVNCIGVFAAIFQLPLILLFINRIRPFSPSKMRKYRKWVIVGSFLLALVLPFSYDPLTQLFMALPIIVLYEISVILITITNRNVRMEPFEPIAKNLNADLVPVFPSEAAFSNNPAEQS